MPTDFGLRELQEYVPRAAERDADVSGWSVGMHIQHVSLAMVAVCQSLVASKPPAPRSGLNLVRSIVFTSGRIPRGRAKSPDPAVPSEGVTEEELRSLLAETERQMREAEERIQTLQEEREALLAENGRLFVVVGEAPAMTAWLASTNADGEPWRESLFETVVPPLTNAPRPSHFVF